MTNKEAFQEYFVKVVAQMKQANSKVPVQDFRVEANEHDAQLWAPDWFRYMIFGREPGKQPPPERMQSYVERNPDVVEQLKIWFQKNITEKQAAFIIGRSIGERGTRIWRGEVQGVPFIEAMERNMPDLLKDLVKSEAVKIQTSLHNAIRNGA